MKYAYYDTSDPTWKPFIPPSDEKQVVDWKNIIGASVTLDEPLPANALVDYDDLPDRE